MKFKLSKLVYYKTQKKKNIEPEISDFIVLLPVVFVPVTHIFLKYITTHTHTVTLESQFSCGLVEPIMPYTNSWSNKILVVWSCHSCRYTAPWVEKCWLCCSTLLRSCEQKIPGIDQRLSNSLGISSKNIQGLSWIGPRFANKRKTWCNQCSLDGLKKQKTGPFLEGTHRECKKGNTAQDRSLTMTMTQNKEWR